MTSRQKRSIRRPFDDIRVLEIACSAAANMSGHVLSGLGADVIKIEKPIEGDPVRKWGPFPKDTPHIERGGLFLYLNHDKRSVTLNLGTAEGRSLLDRLIPQADVLLVDLPPKERRKLRFSYRGIHKVNPNLVMVSISPFGDVGLYKDWIATDFTLAAMGGWLYVTGEPDREPVRSNSQLLVEGVVGVMGALGVLAALFKRGLRDRGEYVEVSGMESLLSLDRFNETIYSYSGHVPNRIGSRLPRTYPYTLLPCKDGYVAVICITDDQWERLCSMIGKPELMEDPRFKDNLSRDKNAEQLDPYLKEWLAPRGKEEIFHTAQEWRLPFGIVSEAADVLELEQHKIRGFFPSLVHPLLGPIPYSGAPFKLPYAPWRIERSAPSLGEHNEEVLTGWLGLRHDEVAGLARRGVI